VRRTLLVRHAQSTWNAQGRWQGWADPPLSPEGERQATAGAERLTELGPFEAVAASDLTRARQTAELLTSRPVLIEPALREYDAGEWSGLTRDQIADQWPGELERWDQGELGAPPGGEDRRSFEARLQAGIRRVLPAAAGQVLIVTHGGVLRALARAAGAADLRAGHLAGYWGCATERGLFPQEAVDLLDGSAPVPLSL
jgi:broad specificity phosphatase PhoE